MGRAESAMAGVSCALAAEDECSPLSCMCCALLLLLSIDSWSCFYSCLAGAASELARLASTPKSLRRPMRANTAPPKTSSPASHPAFTTPPRHLLLPPKSLPIPPSESSPLHFTHPSCLKHEWLDTGFRVTGQRVFCAYSRRPSCTSCIPRVDPSLCIICISYTSSRSLELDLSFLQYDGTKRTPVPFIPHMASICSS
jgi:hypothetical protein